MQKGHSLWIFVYFWPLFLVLILLPPTIFLGLFCLPQYVECATELHPPWVLNNVLEFDHLDIIL